VWAASKFDVGFKRSHIWVLGHVSFDGGELGCISGVSFAEGLVAGNLLEGSLKLGDSFADSSDGFGLEIVHGLLDESSGGDVIVNSAGLVAIKFLVVKSSSHEAFADEAQVVWGKGSVGSNEKGSDEW
jgi:hypothetical protein